MKVKFIDKMDIEFTNGDRQTFQKDEIVPFILIFNDTEPFNPEEGFCDLAFTDGRQVKNVHKSHLIIN